MTTSTPGRTVRRWLRTDEQRVHEMWRVLDLVNSQVRHAETKSIAALATAGLLSQVLLVLAGTLPGRASVLPWVAVGISATCSVCAGGCAAWALWPRLGARQPTPNPLHFGHACADYGFTRATYTRALADLTRDTDSIIDNLAEQVWENAAVARRKFRLANVALGFLLGGLASTVVVASLSLAVR